MHYYRRDGVWNGAGHQSRAPFEEMMHWGEMQAHIMLQSVSRKWSPHFHNILASVDKMQCSTHKYGWSEKWTGQKRGDTSVLVVLVGVSVLRLHYDVCTHKSLCQDHLTRGWVVYLCLCAQNTGSIDWGNWSRTGSWCTGSLVYLMERHIFVGSRL